MALAFTDQRTNNNKKEEPNQEEVNQGQQQPPTISNSNCKPVAMELTVQQHQLQTRCNGAHNLIVAALFTRLSPHHGRSVQYFTTGGSGC
jgi:hypothetical protein